MRYSIRHKAETRQRVLEEAAQEIRSKGPDGVAVAGVMARAGLTHGGFYAHFDSKEAMIAEAIGTMFDDARGRSDAIEQTADPRAALRSYVDFYLSHAHRDRRDRGCPLPSLSGDFARSGAAQRERFGEGVEALTARLAKALGAIGASDPHGEASAMLAQMVGAVALARAVADPIQSDAILADAHAGLVRRYRLGDA
ncbi:MAG: TetR/AcrR family transcriptional regulator [Sphingomonas sp.]|uniref:TetR/AcrR family transcriptional regulator n=1 Tax=Sphingomonas sp. TaxID=28214 RepID=UPI003F80008A